MAQVSQKTIDFIKDKHVQPISCRLLRLRWLVLWLLIVLCVLIGSSIFSILAFGLLDYDWDIFLPLGLTFIVELLADMPLLWILCALIFVLIASFIFRVTRQGYHYQKRKLVIASLGLSVILGGCLQIAGLGTTLDRLADKDVLNYKSVPDRELELWEKPEHGLLAGEIMYFDDHHASLKSPSGEIWTVSLPENTDITGMTSSNCRNVKIIGTPGSEKTFIAKKIYLWKSKFYNCLNPAK